MAGMNGLHQWLDRLQVDAVARAWPLWWSAILVMAGTAAAAAWVSRANEQAAANVSDRTARMAPAATPPVSNEDYTDFTNGLRADPGAASVVAELERACKKVALDMTNLTLVEHPATAVDLGRVELTATLRGPYVGVKEAIAQTLGRFSGVTVRQLRMRRDPSQAVVEAIVVFSIWSAPLAQVPSPERGGR